MESTKIIHYKNLNIRTFEIIINSIFISILIFLLLNITLFLRLIYSIGSFFIFYYLQNLLFNKWLNYKVKIRTPKSQLLVYIIYIFFLINLINFILNYNFILKFISTYFILFIFPGFIICESFYRRKKANLFTFLLFTLILSFSINSFIGFILLEYFELSEYSFTISILILAFIIKLLSIIINNFNNKKKIHENQGKNESNNILKSRKNNFSINSYNIFIIII